MAIPPSDPYPFIYEVAGHIDEIVESVGSFEQFPGLVPVKSQIVAAPDLGDGEDEPPVKQGQPGGGKVRGYGVAIGAVCVDIQGRRAVYRGVPVANDGHRNLHSVPVQGQFPAGHVLRGVVSAGNLLHFPYFQLPRVDVIVEVRPRCGHGRIGETERVFVEFGGESDVGGVGILGEFDVRRFSGTVDDAHLIQTVDSFLHRDVILRHLKVMDVQ